MTKHIPPIAPQVSPARKMAKPIPRPPGLDDILAWENGTMSASREMRFFKRLKASGLLYSLQGCYGRRAHDLGLI